MKILLQMLSKNPIGFTIAIIIAVILLLLIIFIGVLRVPQTKAAYIQGMDKRIVSGRTAIYFRFLEKVTFLDLSLLTSDVSMDDFSLTSDFINIKADTLLKFQLSSEKEALRRSTKLFLNKKENEIKETVEQILKTNLVEVISQFTMKEIIQNKKNFNIKAYESLKNILAEMGISLIYFSVYKVIDEKGIIHDLESENIAKLLKEARISKAQAERDTKEAEMKLAEEIVERTNKFEIKKAELREEVDTKRASADTTYEIEKQKRLKELEELTEAVNTLRETNKEKLSKIRISTAESKLEEERYAADIELYKKQKEAEVMKLSTEAEIENDKMRAMAEAEKLKIRTDTEVEVINKRAEAMEKYGKASMMEIYMKNFPDMNTGIQQTQAQSQISTNTAPRNSSSYFEINNRNEDNKYDYVHDLTDDNEFV